jgi:lysophospholipase L1-like esterase
MERFERAGLTRFTVRDAVIAVALGVVILVLAAGNSIRKAGDAMVSGPGRTAVLAVGKPAAWLAENLPVQHTAHVLTAWLSPDLNLTGPGAFVSLSTTTTNGIPPVTPDAFDPASIGAPVPPKRKLHTLLVTGDSMSEPLDQDLAQMLSPDGVRVDQDPHIGTGLSVSVLVDWGKLAVYQVRHDHPNAIVVFIGANDGFPMPGPNGKQVTCCGVEWATIYAGRARQMMNTYRQAGVATVYWLTLPTPRDPARARISRVVNAAINVAAEPWRDQIRVIDMVPVFTPGGQYRDSMEVNGQPAIVRQSDGIHLNDAGSQLAAKIVLNTIEQDYTK